MMVVQNYVGIFRECSDRDGKLRVRLVLLLSSFIDGGQEHSQPHVLLLACTLRKFIFFVNFAVIIYRGQVTEKIVCPGPTGL